MDGAPALMHHAHGLWTGRSFILFGTTRAPVSFALRDGDTRWRRLAARAFGTGTRFFLVGDTIVSFSCGFGACLVGRRERTSSEWLEERVSFTSGRSGGPDSHGETVQAGDLIFQWGRGRDPAQNVSAGAMCRTDTWECDVLPVEHQPTIRFQHSVVWTGTELIVWGGRGASHVFFDPPRDDDPEEIPGYFNDGGRFRPTSRGD